MADRPVMMCETPKTYWLLCAWDGAGSRAYIEYIYAKLYYPDSLAVCASFLRGENPPGRDYNFYQSVDHWASSFNAAFSLEEVRIWPIDL